MTIGERRLISTDAFIGHVRFSRRINGTLYMFSARRNRIDIWRAIDGRMVHRIVR